MKYGLACFLIFANSPVPKQVHPNVVLSGLGMQEGVDRYGNKDQSIEIVKPEESAASIALTKFQARWPGIRLFYSTKTLKVETMWALMRHGKHVAYVHIPLSMLMNYAKLEWHIVELNKNLKKVEKLLQEPVVFNVKNMTSLGFHLDIYGFRNQPLDPQLAWMWRRQIRHQLNFEFTNHLMSPHFSETYLGGAIGKAILLLDKLLFLEGNSLRSTLGHEIVHATNRARFEKYGDASGQILFYAGKKNTKGLIPREDIPEGYKRFFSTDELEAWSVTEKLEPEARGREGITSDDFILNQIDWLEELHRILPGLLIGQQPIRTSVKVKLFAGAPHEVIVKIPIAQKQAQEMGVEDYLLGTIERRLKQLHNRAKVSGL